jgi:AraC-like DNA-binding protein
MEYITIKQASLNWGIKERQVQTLCKNGRIDGAVRFNRSWAIPEHAPKPVDERRKQPGQHAETNPKTGFIDDMPAEYRQILDAFPLKINISDRYGRMVYANEAFFEKTIDGVRQSAVGTYNIREEEALESWGLKEHVERAFRGERVLTRNLKFPNRDLEGVRYGKDFAFVTIYNDIFSFPVFSGNELKYVVSVFVPVRTYAAREEVARAKEYIEDHWQEPYNNANVAKAVNLSPSNLLRVFKTDTGFTPREYYVEVKINRIKEKLLDVNLSVAQAFNQCGVDYNSHYVRLFHNMTGMNPTQYRKLHR